MPFLCPRYYRITHGFQLSFFSLSSSLYLTVSWLGIRKMMELIDHCHPFRSRVHSPNRNVWLLVLRSLLIELDLGSLHLSKLTLPSPILSRVLVWEGCQCIQTQFSCVQCVLPFLKARISTWTMCMF